MSKIEETWYDIPGFEGKYQLSSILRVRSLDRVFPYVKSGTKILRKRKGRILLKRKTKNGYHTVYFMAPSLKTMYLHKLVALVHLPNPKNKKEVNHIDGNKNNNNISNLEWVTRHENIEHAFKNRLIVPSKGVDQSSTKLTEKEVLEILKSNLTSRKIAAIYHVAKSTILNIKNGNSWGHLTGLKRTTDRRKFKI